MSHSTQDGRIQRERGLPINVTFHTGWKNTETRAYQSMSHSTQDGRIQRQGFTNQCHIPHRMEEYRDKGLLINVTFHTGWKNTETGVYQSMSHSTQDGRIQRQGFTNQCHIPHRMEEYRDKGLPINVIFHTGWNNTETRVYQSMSHSTQDGRIQRQGLTNQCHIPHRMEEYRDKGLPINVTFHTGWKNTETRVYQSMSHSTQDGRIQRQGLTNQCHIPHRMEEYRDKGLPINVTFHTGWKNTETRAYQSMSHSTQDGRIQRQGFTNQCHIPHRMEEYRDKGLPINVTFHTGWKNTETRAYQSMSHSTQDGRIQRQGFNNQCHIPHRMEEYRDNGLPINVTFHTGWKNTDTRAYQSMSHYTQDGRIQIQGLTNQCHIPHRMEEYRDKGLPINVTFHTGWKNTETRAYQSMSHSTQDGRIQRQGLTNQCHIPHRMEEYRDKGLPINVTFHTGWKNTETRAYQSMSHSTQDGRIQRQGFTNQCHIPHRMEEYRDKGLPINVTFHNGWKNTETGVYQSMSHSTQDGRIQRQGLTNQCHIPHRMEEYRDRGLPINVTFHTGWKNTETRVYQSMSHSTQDGRIQRQGFTNQCHIPHRMEEYRDRGLPINVTFHTGWKNTETRAYQSMSHSTQDGRIQRQGLTNQCHIPHRMEEYRDRGLPINVTFHTGWKNTETRVYQSMSHSTHDGRIQRQGFTNQCHIPHRMEEYRDKGLPINVTFHTGWKNTETGVYQSMSHSTQDGRIQRQGLTNQCHIPHRMEEYRDNGLPINVTFHTGWKNTETRAYQSMSHSTQDGRIQRQGFTNQCHIPHRMEEYRDKGLPINVTFHTGWKNTETRAYQSMSHSTQDGRIQRQGLTNQCHIPHRMEEYRDKGLPINVTFHTGWKNTETGVYQSMSHSTQDGRIQRQGLTNQCHIPHRMEEYRDKGLPINVTFHTGWKNTETRV